VVEEVELGSTALHMMEQTVGLEVEQQGIVLAPLAGQAIWVVIRL